MSSTAAKDTEQDKLEQQQEEQEQEFERKQYEENVARLEKQLANRSFGQDQKLTAKEEIQLLLGLSDSDKFITERSEEAKVFATTMNLIKESTAKEAPTQKLPATDTPQGKKLLLPQYKSQGVVISAALDRGIIGIVHATTQENKKMSKGLLIKKDTVCDEFIKLSLQKMTSNFQLSASSLAPENFVLKAVGASEFFYGESKLIDYEYVRKCLSQGIEIHLLLVDLDTAIKNCTDLVDLSLVNCNYDIAYTIEERETIYNHDKIEFQAKHAEQADVFSSWDLQVPFRLRMKDVTAIPIKNQRFDVSNHQLFVSFQLYLGGSALTKRKLTRMVPVSGLYAPQSAGHKGGEEFLCDACFTQLISFEDILIAELPRESVLWVTVYARPESVDAKTVIIDLHEKDVPVCFIKLPLFNFKGQLKTGIQKLRMWESFSMPPTSKSALVENVESEDSILIFFDLPKYNCPIVCPLTGKVPPILNDRYAKFTAENSAKYKADKLKPVLQQVLAADPLHVLNDEEKWAVWSNRSTLKTNPKALGRFLQSVPWQYPVARHMAKDYLKTWTAPVHPLDTIELLNYKYGDTPVRQYAALQLNKMSDVEFADFLLQLVQALKFELYHDSALSRLLIERAVKNNHIIGAKLFWMLKSELHENQSMERHGLLIYEYLMASEKHRAQLVEQNSIVEQLLVIALKIKKVKDVDARKDLLHEQLKQVKLPPTFRLPINPKMVFKGFNIPKCKVMGSKKLPVWLRVENADEDCANYDTIFKAGDDLRQDVLTLQMLKFMDNIWKNEQLDLHIIPYGCVATGDNVGFIEVVTNSDTLANITDQYGGSLAAMSNMPLKSFLENERKKDPWETVVDNFVVSNTGYAVACYVLGIGDRHNDNIMLRRNGDLFHIDFGHILGNYKSFHGIKKETTPFVFTTMYSTVMDGEGSPAFIKFTKLCSQAYNIVRKHGNILTVLFTFMLSCGIPELPDEAALLWLRNCLILEKTDQQAGELFTQLIHLALTNTRTRLNDFVHIFVHKQLKSSSSQKKSIFSTIFGSK